MTSALRNSFASKITQPRPNDEAASISAPTTAIHARWKARRRPVMMNGSAPGTTTFQKSAAPLAPIAPAARSHRGFTARTPVQVLTSIGKLAASNTMTMGAVVPRRHQRLGEPSAARHDFIKQPEQEHRQNGLHAATIPQRTTV